MPFYQNVTQCCISLPEKFYDKIRRGPLDRGLKLEWGVFDIAMLYSMSETVRNRA